MQLTHNLAAVSARLDRLQKRDMPVAMENALHRTVQGGGDWLELARERAKKSVLAVADPKHRQFIDPFVETLTKTLFPGGLLLSLRSPFSRAKSLADFMSGFGSRRVSAPAATGDKIQTQTTGQAAGFDLFSQAANELDDLLAEWVATEKDKDKRDWGKSDEEIGSWIGHLLTTPDELLSEHAPIVREDGTVQVSEREAKRKFMPHILKWLAQKQSAPVSAPVLDSWFRAVLAGWVALFREVYPHRVRAELRLLREELPL